MQSVAGTAAESPLSRAIGESDLATSASVGARPLRLLLVAEYVRRLPSSATRWIPELARAMASRGHDVTLALGGADDHDETQPIRTLIHNSRRTHTGADPRAFLRWVEEVRARREVDACISFTRLLAGDLCIPLGASSAAYLKTLFRTKAPHSAIFEVGHRLWLFPSMWIERRATGGYRADQAGAAEAHPRFVRLATLGPAIPGAINLGYASSLKVPEAAAREVMRARTRELLGLSPSRLVLVASGAHVQRSGLREVLEGLAQVRARSVGGAPVLLLVGRRSHTLHQMALKAGVAEGVRLLGETARMDAVLAAADAGIAASPLSESRDEAFSGRFVADVLRMGKPLLAHARAAGAEFLIRAVPAGMVIKEQTPAGWAEAIQAAMDSGWRKHATAAAEAESSILAIESAIQRLEATLGVRQNTLHAELVTESVAK